MSLKHIVVLNDGETWTEIKGCKVVSVLAEDLEELADGTKTLKEVSRVDVDMEELFDMYYGREY